MEMTAKQRLERAMYQLSTHEHYKFFGAILMSGDIHIDTSVSTGATDGLNCYYNPEFILSLTEPELRFLLIHEAYHKMFKHVFVWANLRHGQAIWVLSHTDMEGRREGRQGYGTD